MAADVPMIYGGSDASTALPTGFKFLPSCWLLPCLSLYSLVGLMFSVGS
jgi:hypothetical protein